MLAAFDSAARSLSAGDAVQAAVAALSAEALERSGKRLERARQSLDVAVRRRVQLERHRERRLAGFNERLELDEEAEREEAVRELAQMAK